MYLYQMYPFFYCVGFFIYLISFLFLVHATLEAFRFDKNFSSLRIMGAFAFDMFLACYILMMYCIPSVMMAAIFEFFDIDVNDYLLAFFGLFLTITVVYKFKLYKTNKSHR